MLQRYPHTAILIPQVKELTRTEPDDGITGRDTENEAKYSIQGRFEDTSGHGGDYKAKFYAKVNPLFQYIHTDKGKLEIAGRSWDVIRMFPYQMHVEIWLA